MPAHHAPKRREDIVGMDNSTIILYCSVTARRSAQRRVYTMRISEWLEHNP